MQQWWCLWNSFACRAEEEASFKDFAAQPELHKKIFELIAPSIYGHDDIKKAVACLLFGGARKVKLAPFAPPLAALHVQLVHHFSHSNAQDTLRHNCIDFQANFEAVKLTTLLPWLSATF